MGSVARSGAARRLQIQIMVLRMDMWDMDAVIWLESGVHYTVKLEGYSRTTRSAVLGEKFHPATTLEQASRFLLRACASSILPSFRVHLVLLCFRFESVSQLVRYPVNIHQRVFRYRVKQTRWRELTLFCYILIPQTSSCSLYFGVR